METTSGSAEYYAIAFQQGKEQGFSYFFKGLFPSLVYFSSRIIKHREIAEDIVEESFIKIWERHANFSNAAVIKAWLYTTVRNASLTKLQQLNREQSKQEALAIEVKDSFEESPANEIIRAEVIKEMHALIESLPKQCRKVFKLLYIEGKSVREAAAELNITISTVKNQKARGLGLIRNRFPDFTAVTGICVMILEQIS